MKQLLAAALALFLLAGCASAKFGANMDAGEKSLAKKKYEDAMSAFSDAQKEDPTSKKAQEMYEKAKSLYIQSLFDDAKAAYQAKNLPQAQSLLQQHLALSPNNEEAKKLLDEVKKTTQPAQVPPQTKLVAPEQIVFNSYIFWNARDAAEVQKINAAAESAFSSNAPFADRQNEFKELAASAQKLLAQAKTPPLELGKELSDIHALKLGWLEEKIGLYQNMAGGGLTDAGKTSALKSHTAEASKKYAEALKLYAQKKHLDVNGDILDFEGAPDAVKK